MSPESNQIFNFLYAAHVFKDGGYGSENGGWVPLGLLADQCFGKKARDLRGKDGEPGILERAMHEIYEETGWVLVTSMLHKGVKITKDIEEIKYSKNEWRKWLAPQWRKINFLNHVMGQMLITQEELPLTGEGSDGR